VPQPVPQPSSGVHDKALEPQAAVTRDPSTQTAAVAPRAGGVNQNHATTSCEEAVMSTDQVLSLIDGLSDDTYLALNPMPRCVEPGLPQCAPRFGGMIAAPPAHQAPSRSSAEPALRWNKSPGPPAIPGLSLRLASSGELSFEL